MEDHNYGEEQKLVVNSFQQGFTNKRNQKIVLYGIGKNTEAILRKTKGFQFCGLMDQNTVGQTFFQQKVLSEEEVIKLHPVIVIIARESVISIIFKRIQYLYVEHGINIFNYKGEMLGKEQQTYQNEELPYWNVSEKDILRVIKKHDIISFDIFDTLLMRRVLQPEDVFTLVEKKLKEKGIACSFREKRIEAERSLVNCPNLDEIYDNLADICGWNYEVKEEVKAIECLTDYDVIVPRKKMCEVFRYATKLGKKIYLISDMYYSKKDMKKILEKNGITGYEDVFISCDIKRQKSDGTLYKWFLAHCGENAKVLHIGDNRRVDIEKARECGLDSFHVYSSYEILMASAMQDILVDIKTIREKCIVGLVISEIYNNPFVMYGSRGYYNIHKGKDVGYSFIGPFMMEYIQWFQQKVKENHIEQVLFPSRDGYLIQKIYKQQKEQIDNVYFRVSRRAATVAGITDLRDIQRVAQRAYQGNYGDFLKNRFGIAMRKDDLRAENDVNKRKDLLNQILTDYEAEILQEAREERKSYFKYLDKKKIINRKKQVIFDFVAGGTVQYNFGKLLQKDLKGMYFATMNLPNDMYKQDTGMIDTAYGNIQSYGTNNNLAKYYLLLETILVDGKAAFSHIDDKGHEIYETSDREVSKYPEIKKVQQAVMYYCDLWKKSFYLLNNEKPALQFVDQLLGMLFTRRCIVDDDVKNIFYNDDIYDGVSVYSLWPDEGA